MRVLILNPRIELAELLFSTPPLSCLGPLYSAAYLRRFHDVQLVDSFLLPDALPANGGRSNGARSERYLGATDEALLNAVNSEAVGEFDAVVIHKARWWKQQRRPALFAGLRARYPRARLLLADLFLGDLYLPPYDPLAYLRDAPELDALLYGAGEGALLAALEQLCAGGPPAPGLAIRGPDGELRFDEANYDNLVDDLDEIPPPAYDLAGVDRYLRFFIEAEAADMIQEMHEGEPYLGLLATRGCNNRCRFCAMPGYGMRHRHHSLGYFERTLDAFEAETPARKIVFADAALNHKRSFFNDLLRLLVERGYRFVFSNGLRLDRIDDEALELIAHGSSSLMTSLENPDPAALRERIGKNLDPNLARRLAEKCEKLGLPLLVHYIIGMPGETMEQIDRTLRYAAQLFEDHGARPLVQVATPIPGTELFELCQRRGYLDLPAEEIARNIPVLLQQRSVISTPEMPGTSVDAAYKRFQSKFGPAPETPGTSGDHPKSTAPETPEMPGTSGDHPKSTAPEMPGTSGDHPKSTAPEMPGTSGNANNERSMTLHITSACNNKRRPDAAVERALPELTLDEARQRLAAAHADGIREVILAGGEPTLHPELPAIIGESRTAGMKAVVLLSNGRLLAHGDRARQLVDAGLTEARITVHGANAATHDAITAAPGSFVETLRGLRNLRAAGVPRLVAVLSFHDEQQLERAQRILRAVGGGELRIRRVGEVS